MNVITESAYQVRVQPFINDRPFKNDHAFIYKHSQRTSGECL